MNKCFKTYMRALIHSKLILNVLKATWGSIFIEIYFGYQKKLPHSKIQNSIV